MSVSPRPLRSVPDSPLARKTLSGEVDIPVRLDSQGSLRLPESLAGAPVRLLDEQGALRWVSFSSGRSRTSQRMPLHCDPTQLRIQVKLDGAWREAFFTSESDSPE
ncbi:MAG: hypothetical protein H6686_01185 [Fibrobacteria bacterium]|nr:hypothetical protein [Fibrobacteria bacterium]